MSPTPFKPDKLIAKPEIKLPTPYHEEICLRSVVQPYAFEKFLKLYHLLELIFDWDFVQRIKGLNDDLQGIGKLLRDYDTTKELNLLKAFLDTINPFLHQLRSEKFS